MKFIPKIRSALWSAVLLAFPAVLTSQNLPNNTFISDQTLTCPYDSTPYMNVASWTAFQTTDSTRWGPRDSACIPTEMPASGAALRIRDLDPTLPVYFNCNLADDSVFVPLDSNNLYKIDIFSSSTNPNIWEFGSACKEDICSGFEFGIQVPDSAGTGLTTRWYPYLLTGNSWDEFCIPTERFPNGNQISRAWLKYTPSGNGGPQDSIRISSIYIEDMRFNTEQVRDIKATFFNGTTYEYVFQQFSNNCATGICPNKLLMYTAPTYPSASDISFVEVSPEPNTSTQQTVDVYVEFDSYLTMQPFVELRGGHVLGDTLRHNFNLINNGSTICTFGFAELIFENGDYYTHRAGKVAFGSKNSCMLLGRGGGMRIEDGVTFHYGQPGAGMLAIKTGGKLIFGRGSELVIHNKLIFGEYKDDPEAADIHIYLDRGSKLAFAPGSELSNQFSKFPEECKLNVHLRGGILDDSGLSEAEKQLIRRIYDDPYQALADNLSILGNPFSAQLGLSILGAGGEDIALELYGVDGKLHAARTLRLEKGQNDLQIDTRQLPAGLYLLQVGDGKATITKRVLKMD